jgi:ribose transport system ATP-binding protein
LGAIHAVLTLSGIKKRFGPTVALDGVDLDLRPGEVHALIGENGAGKSTLMNVLAGSLRADAGTMTLRGAPYAPGGPLDARRSGVALIHQELSLCGHLTVAENILMGLEPARARWIGGGWLDASAMARETAAVLEAFHHPELKADRRVMDLPIAARQVIEICRAMAARASIVLMDEPTSSLPREDVERLFALIRRLRERGVAIVYISHFLEEVREIADRFTVLRDGRSVASGELSGVTNDHLISHMVGRPMDALFPEHDRDAPGAPLLDVKELVAPPVVRQASLTLREGEILGIAGLVGSGRTELVRALMGLAPIASGSVALGSKAIGSKSIGSKSIGSAMSTGAAKPWTRISQGAGYLSEDRKGEGLALTLSLADNITFTRLDACATAGWLNLAAQRREAARWIETLRVKARTPLQAARTLSGGNQQKVALARLMHQQAAVLLLDEPTKGIDIGSKVEIYRAIVDVARQRKAVLVVSSYLPELFGLCDSLAVMCRGRLSPTRAIRDWTPETVMAAAIGA